VISRREAGWGIKIAAIETLARIAASDEGTYAFVEGPATPMQPPFRLPVDHWILELFLRSNDRSFVLRKIGATDIPIARVEGFAEGFSALGLTADADAVAEGIDGVRTVEKVVKHSRADEFATLKLLAALMTLGLIHPILEAPRAPAPPGNEPEPLALEREGPFEEALPEPGSEREPDVEPVATSERSDEYAVEGSEWNDPDGAAVTAAMSIDGDADIGEPEQPPIEEDSASPFPPSLASEETAAGAFEPSFPPAPLPEARDQASVINLPLFALTAPEEPASEPIIEREEEAATVGGPRRGGRAWMIAAVAAAAVVAAFLVVRRLPTAAVAPTETPTPPASGSAAAVPHGTAPANPAPKPPPVSPSEIVVSHAPAARTPGPAAPKGAPAVKAGGEAKWKSLGEAGGREFEHPGKHRYSIQLELACEDSTLEKAFAADPGRSHIWIAPYAFRGRRCYRVLWGRFADIGAARTARGSVPAVFSRDGNRPAIVALGGKASGAKH
jgi:septal ring-binding cell division protein DamX